MADDEEEDPDDRKFKELFLRLREDPDVVRVGNVFVDIPGTVHRMVACADGLCMRSGPLDKLVGKTCCTTFRVELDEKDVEQVARVVHKVRKIRDVGDAIDRAEGWWEIEEDGAHLKTRPSGACVFLSARPDERPWCTIHEWAVKQGLNFRDYKPETCCLFPLYTLEWGDDILITSYGTPLMRECEPDEGDEIYPFACVNPPEGRGVSALVEQRGELEYRLGHKRWNKVLDRLRSLGHDV